MSNVQQPFHSHVTSLQQSTDDMMQAVASSPASSFDSSSYLATTPQRSQFSMSQNAPTSAATSRTAHGLSNQAFQSFETVTGGMESPSEPLSAVEYQNNRDGYSDISVGGSMTSAADKHREAGKRKGKRKGASVDGSEAQSPTSSRDAGAQIKDDQNLGDYNDGNTDSGKQEQEQDQEPEKPAWSELKTKAGKERKRLPLACIACRRKKIRCSGEKPACKHCVRSRIPCVYKVTARKAAPRTDYMTMLDKRLKRMEERVIRIIPDTDPEKMAKIGRASVKPPSQQTAKSTSAKKRAADEAFTNEIEEWAARSHTADYTRPPQNTDHGDNGLLTDGAEYLPPKEIQEHLAETFFDYVYGQSYHLLHKPSYMRRLRAGTNPPVLTLAVCAISARFSPHPDISTEPSFLRGEQWAKPARDIALKRYDEPNITILIVLLILGLHEFGTCQGGRSWMLGGMAMRMGHALQLHRELDHDPLGRKKDKSSELSFTDREIRRRTIWACFLMDRFNSSGTERPMMMHEHNIEVQLPIKDTNFKMEIPGPTETLTGDVPNPISPGAGQMSDPGDNMGVAAYIVRSIAIWGRVIRYLNLGGKSRDPYPMWDSKSRFADLKRQVDEFAEKLPARLKFSSENLQNYAAENLANQYLFMHISHYQSILFLHRFAIPTTPGAKRPADMPADFAKRAGKLAHDAATKISDILANSSAHTVTAPFAGYCAFVSSTIHIWGIFSKNPQLEASSKRNLASNVKYLSTMKKYWGIFYHMADNLRTIYQQHANAAIRGPNSTGDDKASDTNVFEYGNWFNTYPHGVSRTDYQEPAATDPTSPGTDAALSQKSDLQTVEEFFNTVTPTSLGQRKARKANGSLSHLSHNPQPPHGAGLKLQTSIPHQHRSSRHHDPNAPLIQLSHRPGSEPRTDPLDAAFNSPHLFQQQAQAQHSPFVTSPHHARHAQHLQQQQHQHQRQAQMQQQHQQQQPQHQHPHPHAQHTPTDPTDPFHAALFPNAHLGVSINDMDRQFVFDAYAADQNNASMLWDFGIGDSGGGGGGGGGAGGAASSTSGAGGGSQIDVNSPVAGSIGAALGAGVGGGGGGAAGRMHGVQQGGGGGVQSAYGDASSAWFMPFNLAPPDVGEDPSGGGGGAGFGFGGGYKSEEM